jgi:hypothetical protein
MQFQANCGYSEAGHGTLEKKIVARDFGTFDRTLMWFWTLAFFV